MPLGYGRREKVCLTVIQVEQEWVLGPYLFLNSLSISHLRRLLVVLEFTLLNGVEGALCPCAAVLELLLLVTFTF